MSAVSRQALSSALEDLDPTLSTGLALQRLVAQGLDRLALPGQGVTLDRWHALAAVAAHDLSLVKLYEGHTDALAILSELGCGDAAVTGSTWGTWAAEAPAGRAVIREARGGDEVILDGGKCWCSGAQSVSHGVLTAWHADGRGPQLVWLTMDQSQVTIDDSAWQAIGMAGSASVDLRFDGARAHLVGSVGDYLARPGFWQGGAGIAACWYGGATAIAEYLRTAAQVDPAKPGARPPDDFRRAALGRVDLALTATAALLREAAAFIDAQPATSAQTIATRVRLAAEACARTVIDEVGRSLGAAPYCRDARYARLVADLPVFVRQSHADRDYAALGDAVRQDPQTGWSL